MSREQDVKDDYFGWMCHMVCKGRYENSITYRKLLSYLHSVEFTYRIRSDGDRAHDGVNLRRRFALLTLTEDYDYVMECLDGSCSVLEMMIALAIRLEETIMTDPQIGDRTGQWFWKMIVNLGLGPMTDDRYDEMHVEEVVNNFLKRKYEPNGHGGLFIIHNCTYDLRRMSIWTQMCHFLDTII